jgi:hypothetical protein
MIREGKKIQASTQSSLSPEMGITRPTNRLPFRIEWLSLIAHDWGALLFGIAVMVPAGYYFFFLLLRVTDLFRAASRRHNCSIPFARGISRVHRLVLHWFLRVGRGSRNRSVLLDSDRPTVEGSRLLKEIEGFREFLRSVEKLPMDQPEGPARNAGRYEEYLPYAVALEVEQRWADNQLVSASFFHEEPQLGTRPFYLGTWDGKPVEIVYKPPPNSRRGW